MTEKPDFNINFEHEGQIYRAKAWHYSQLTVKDRVTYGITENSFLVKLDGPHDFKPFEIYIGEDLEWHTKSTFIVGQELVDKIGELIDRKSK